VLEGSNVTRSQADNGTVLLDKLDAIGDLKPSARTLLPPVKCNECNSCDCVHRKH